ncbi:MAG TPA: T9SS type A sorting domain-containing protein, partial [Bacteroidia bacterium]|nr:T9SS type A sorting domain-containing protein [Bacteroidia bacterium]
GVLNNVFFSSAAGGQGMKTITYEYTDPGTGCTNAVDQPLYVDICTGLYDDFRNPSVSVYPNPAGDVVQLEINSARILVDPIEFIDITGKQVLKLSPAHASTVKNVYTVNTSQFSSGVYFIKINTDSGSQYTRLLIEH